MSSSKNKSSVVVKPVRKATKYLLPIEPEMSPSVDTYFSLPPNSKYWVHGVQTDDTLNTDTERRTKIIAELKKIIVPEQRSAEWYVQRDGMITASLIPTALGMNEYEPQYMAIMHKIIEIPFTGKQTCFWGKKFESVATNIYQYRMNVIVEMYGCITHKCGFIGASPDGIISVHKLDKIHKTNLVGKMLEVKCVVSRKINLVSNDIFEVIPEHYYPQPQIQMQCCNLDECDFWQCNIKEYKNREEFIADTDPNEPFRSKSNGFEKGVIIQLLPVSALGSKTCNLDEIRWDFAKWIYPDKIEMSPYECDQWVAQTCTTYRNDAEWENYVIDKIIYWKLVESRCMTTKRDDKWFAKHYPTLEKIWNYVLFLRENEMQKKIFLDYVKYAETKFGKKSANKYIMETMKVLFDTENKKYKKNIAEIKDEIKEGNKPIMEENDFDGFSICE
jgi:putative phage-type endonuclease